MKFFKFILIFLFLLLPLCVQAGSYTLLNKLRGVWYNNLATVFFDFEDNRYFLIIGASFYTVPITNIETIANVLFFETTSGIKTSMRLVSSDLAVWTSENTDEPYNMYRWKKGNISRNFFNGAWTTSDGTIVYDFNKNQSTFIYKTNKEIFDMIEIQEIGNVLFYQEAKTKIVCCIRYVTDNMISLSTNKHSSYAILHRWHENQ